MLDCRQHIPPADGDDNPFRLVGDRTIDRGNHALDHDAITIDDRPRRRLRVQIISDMTGSSIDQDIVAMPDVDVVVAAGDIAASAVDAVHRLRENFPAPMPIVMVLGDRDLAGADRATSIGRAQTAARECGVTLLENGSAIVGGVRFVGATLWSNFRLAGDDVPSIEAALKAAEATFRAMDVGEGNHRRLCPYGSMWANAWSHVCLGRTLMEQWPGPTVVVTHHAPSALCLPPSVRHDPLAPTLASPLEDLVRLPGIALWVHGHVPEPVDLIIGATRVVAAPHRSERAPTVVEVEQTFQGR